MKIETSLCVVKFGRVIRLYHTLVFALLAGLPCAPVQGQTRDYAYVAFHDSDSISVIDTVTNTEVDTILVSGKSQEVLQMAFAFTPDRKHAYVTSYFSTTDHTAFISVIDTVSDAVVAIVPVQSLGAPTGVAVTPDGLLAYVTLSRRSAGNGAVGIISTSSNSLLGTLPVGITPGEPAMSAKGMLFVPNQFSKTISVINTRTAPGHVLTTINLGTTTPDIVSFTPDGTLAFVSTTSGTTTPYNAALQLIDASTFATVANIPLGPGPAATRTVFNSTGALAYTILNRESCDTTHCYFSPILVVIDVASRKAVKAVPLVTLDPSIGLVFTAWDLAITSDGTSVFVTGHELLNADLNRVWVINTAMFTLTTTIDYSPGVLAWPGDVAIATLARPDLPRVAYVGSRSGTVTAIDTDTNTVKATIAVPDTWGDVALSPDVSRVYATSGFGLFSIDTATNMIAPAETVTFPVALVSGGLAITPDGTRAFVTHGGSQPGVWVVDLVHHSLITPTPIPLNGGQGGDGVAISPDGTRAYVCSSPGGSVTVIDTSSLTVVSSISGILQAQDVAFTPDGKFAYVTSGNQVAVIDTSNPTVVSAWIPTALNVGFIGVAVTPNSRFAYAIDYNQGYLLVINTTTNTVFTSLNLVPSPATLGWSYIAMTRGGSRAYVTDDNAGSVFVLDTASNAVLATIPVNGAWGVTAH